MILRHRLTSFEIGRPARTPLNAVEPSRAGGRSKMGKARLIRAVGQKRRSS
jgi:hypothetical protein